MTVEHVGTAWEQGASDSLTSAIASSEQTQTPLLIRFNLDLYDRVKQQYTKWRGQIWKVELTEAKQVEAVGLRDALGLFFTLYGRVGSLQVATVLQAALAETDAIPGVPQVAGIEQSSEETDEP